MPRFSVLAKQWLLAALLLATLTMSGCANLGYYGQAISGQWQLLQSRRPVQDILADSNTPLEVKHRLQVAWSIREFASTELALPDNGSYRNYADLQRAYVVRNVFATPPLSLQPRQWCFPLIGCVSYRGYFNADTAEQFAEILRAQGDDVYIANVPAYSTLGWFDDPLLNTFVHWPVGRLAELIFHELAHHRLFISNDTIFNESFATAVGRLGAQQWLARYGTSTEREDYERQQRRRPPRKGAASGMDAPSRSPRERSRPRDHGFAPSGSSPVTCCSLAASCWARACPRGRGVGPRDEDVRGAASPHLPANALHARKPGRELGHRDRRESPERDERARARNMDSAPARQRVRPRRRLQDRVLPRRVLLRGRLPRRLQDVHERRGGVCTRYERRRSRFVHWQRHLRR
ncbi:MAG: aminopeptidase, partial [Candidatus Competibacteraceae bacterium]|nr:aminopeptidase [Candidatus Competibacteraceae bacterium]